MLGKTQLLVLIVLSFVFGCKNIDYGALDADTAKPPSAWALVDFFVHVSSSESGAEKGEIELRLHEELRHESNFGGVNTTFMASESLVFAAPDVATNEAIPDSETALIDMVGIEIVDAKDRFICPEGNGVVANLVRNLVRNTDEIRSSSTEIIFRATDLACGGNKLVELSKLVGSIDDLALVPSHTWKSADTARAKEILQEVDAFHAQESKEGGALQKTQHEGINELIDVFLMRRKMLQGYVKMREEINSHVHLETMAGEVFDAEKPDAKHVVIPAVLNGFLDPQVNRVDLEDTAVADSDDFDAILLKEALLSTVLKFLQYQEMFQSEMFESSKYAKRFVEEKNRFSGDLRAYIDEVEKQFNANVDQTNPMVYRNVSDVAMPLNLRINNLNTFLKKDEMSCEEYTCKKEGGKDCRQNPKQEVCENLTPRFYDELLAPSCQARGEEEKHSDLYVLLMTQKIMEATRINKPCEKYIEAASLSNIDKSQDIIDGIVALKKRTSENLKTLADIHSQGGGNHFRQKLFENHYYTLIPAVTKYPDKAAEIAADLRVAHDEIYKKREKDENWQKRAKILLWASGIFGGLAIVTAIIPPLGMTLGALGGLTVTVAGTLGAASVLAGASLFVVSTSDWINERKEFQELERAIYGGGQGNAAAQADALRAWHQARTDSMIEGLGLLVVARPAHLLVKGGPQAFRAFFPRNLQRIQKLGKGSLHAVRHPVQASKGLARRTKEMFSGQRLWGLKGGANLGDDVIRAGDDVIRTGDDVVDGLRMKASHAKKVERELVRYNVAMQNKASMLNDLKKLRKSFLGIGKPKGVARVTDSGDVLFSARKEGLSDNRFNKIEEFFKEKAELSGGKLKFEHLEVGGRHNFRLLHVNRNVARENLGRAKLMRLQTQLGKGVPTVKSDGSWHFLVKRAGTPPAQLQKIEEVFKPQTGFQLKISNDLGGYRRYSLVPKPAP